MRLAPSRLVHRSQLVVGGFEPFHDNFPNFTLQLGPLPAPLKLVLSNFRFWCFKDISAFSITLIVAAVRRAVLGSREARSTMPLLKKHPKATF